MDRRHDETPEGFIHATPEGFTIMHTGADGAHRPAGPPLATLRGARRVWWRRLRGEHGGRLPWEG